MRVCILTSVHPLLDTRIFHRQAKALLKGGYEVILVAQHEQRETIEGIRVEPLPTPKGRLGRLLLIPRLIRAALKSRAAIYHIHDPELLPAAIFIKLVSGKRIIYDVHEDYSAAIRTKRWIPGPLRSIISKSFGFIERTMSRLFDAVVTVTDEIEQKFPPAKTIQVRNYPIFEEKGAGAGVTEGESFNLIYAGGLTRIRGIKELVESLNYLDERVRLKLFGAFASKSFEEELRSLPAWKRVDFGGWVNRDRVIKEMESSQIGLVCLHPIDRYQVALPVKLFEYMAAGLPVIASDFPFWRQFVLEEQCGLMVDPMSPQAIAGAVRKLLSDPALCRKMGRRGQEAARSKYNWQSEERKLLELYKRLMSRM